jgi:2-C-methyl-D-erythritol 4-phosphate cytidylyltransferase
VRTAAGGAERCDSVQNCLAALLADAEAEDWVLVHDAARPCVRRSDIDRLIAAARQHAVGAILALPARDTMKRADAAGCSIETVERAGLWHAQTPQMFRIGPLRAALADAIGRGRRVTDEAQAMELLGLRPLLVPGPMDNIKITRAEDLELAARILAAQERAA